MYSPSLPESPALYISSTSSLCSKLFVDYCFDCLSLVVFWFWPVAFFQFLVYLVFNTLKKFDVLVTFQFSVGDAINEFHHPFHFLIHASPPFPIGTIMYSTCGCAGGVGSFLGFRPPLRWMERSFTDSCSNSSLLSWENTLPAIR